MLDGEGVLLAADQIQYFQTEDTPVWMEAINQQFHD
jgi:hypothetical protein